MAGIHDLNPAFIIQGSVPTAAKALLIDELLKIGEGYA
jgi:ABC-type proline/glycine betaine transport system permease subunit